MASVQNYKCLACGGPLGFDAATGNLVCPYCDSTYSPEEMAKEAEKNGSAAETSVGGDESQWNTDNLSNDWGDEAENLRSYNCPSCGANIVCEKTTAATSCPYCNNPTVVESHFAGSLKPDYIIPFKVIKQKAVDSLKDFYKGKPLLPNTFAASNHLEEVKGVYVPFYFFDGTASGSVSFQATKVEHRSKGDEDETITSHFQCDREGEIDFKMVPVDASVQMDDDIMDSIEPYDYKDLKDFSTGFLPGYLADIHDVSVEDCFERANTRCVGSCIQAMKETVTGYDSCRVSTQNIKLKRGDVHYGLLPVYILNTKFEEKKFVFAVNGQTGKVVGSLPSSVGKAVGRFFRHLFLSLVIEVIIAAIICVTSSDFLMDFKNDPLPIFVALGIFSLIFAGVGLCADKKKMNNVSAAVEAKNYTVGGIKLSYSKDTFTNKTVQVTSRKTK